MNFATELESVFADSIGNVINELGNGVRPLELWPLESAQTGEEISTEADAGQPASQRSDSHSGVETITRCRCIQIARQRGLVEAVVSESGFVHPTRTGNPYPTTPDHLGSGVNV